MLLYHKHFSEERKTENTFIFCVCVCVCVTHKTHNYLLLIKSEEEKKKGGGGKALFKTIFAREEGRNM